MGNRHRNRYRTSILAACQNRQRSFEKGLLHLDEEKMLASTGSQGWTNVELHYASRISPSMGKDSALGTLGFVELWSFGDAFESTWFPD